MQRLHTLAALTFLTLLIPAAAASAAEQTLTLEPEATQVTFLLPATGHDVEGRLYLQSGEIAFDPATGAAWGEIRIDAVRAETGSKKRDKKMHAKVLESARFPSIVFVPERLEGELAASGSSDVVLVGNVTIHGAAHTLTLPTRVVIDSGRATAAAVEPAAAIVGATAPAAWIETSTSWLTLRNRMLGSCMPQAT